MNLKAEECNDCSGVIWRGAGREVENKYLRTRRTVLWLVIWKRGQSALVDAFHQCTCLEQKEHLHRPSCFDWHILSIYSVWEEQARRASSFRRCILVICFVWRRRAHEKSFVLCSTCLIDPLCLEKTSQKKSFLLLVDISTHRYTSSPKKTGIWKGLLAPMMCIRTQLQLPLKIRSTTGETIILDWRVLYWTIPSTAPRLEKLQ